MDSSQAPLMADNREGDDVEADEDNVHQGRLTKDLDANPGVFVVALTIAAGISGLLFGCKPNPQEYVRCNLTLF